MKNSDNSNDDTGPKAKLPYEKPGVVSDHVFETLALSCHGGHPTLCGGDDHNNNNQS